MPKRKPKPAMPRVEAVLAPDVRIARGEMLFEPRTVINEITGRVTGMTTGNRIQDWLMRHKRAGDIDEQQFRAGERLQEDAERSQVSIPSLLNPSRIAGGLGRDIATIRLGSDAWQAINRFRGALAACGPCRGVIEVVVIWGHSARHWARLAGRPDRDGIAALRLGLDGLVDYYRMDDS